jgi:hypothetical protein
MTLEDSISKMDILKGSADALLKSTQLTTLRNLISLSDQHDYCSKSITKYH